MQIRVSSQDEVASARRSRSEGYSEADQTLVRGVPYELTISDCASYD